MLFSRLLLASGGICAQVWCARYNRFHDQLVLSAGSDHSVALWSAVSISSGDLLLSFPLLCLSFSLCLPISISLSHSCSALPLISPL